MINAIYQFIYKFAQMLPDDQLAISIQESEIPDWLGYLNYFVPIGWMLAVTALWAGAVFAYWIFTFLLGKGQGFLSALTGNGD